MDLFPYVQVLRLSDLLAVQSGYEPARAIIQNGQSVQPGSILEFSVDGEEPFLAEIRLYDPPKDVWAVQEFVLVLPGKVTPVGLGVYSDAASWPANGRERLREALLREMPIFGTYSALRGRIFGPSPAFSPIPTSAEFSRLFDTSFVLERQSRLGKPEIIRLGSPMVNLGDDLDASHWYEVPLPPGSWTLVVDGPRVRQFSRTLTLKPGCLLELGDIVLEPR